MAKIAEAIRAVPSQSADRAVEDEDLGERLPEVEEAPAGPQEAPAEPRAEARDPAGTAMATVTVREALRDAMAEEMRRDKDVFVMGEEVGDPRAPTRSRRACSTSSATTASSTRPSPSMASPASASAPPSPG